LTYIPDEPVQNSDANECRGANGCRNNSIRYRVRVNRKEIVKKWWIMDAEYDGLP